MASPSAALPDAVAGPARAYNAHHFGCPTCIAAGTNRSSERCPTGAELHRAYEAAFATLPPLPAWKPRPKKP